MAMGIMYMYVCVCVLNFVLFEGLYMEGAEARYGEQTEDLKVNVVLPSVSPKTENLMTITNLK